MSSLARKSFTVFLLAFLNFLNATDRYIVAGLLAQIAPFYTISDSTAGLLQTVYILVYVVVAPLFGYLGDRYNRKWLCVSGLLIWISLILASSFVPQNMFWMFMTLRAFSGMGDAVINTLAPSLMGDMFSVRGRGFSLMIYYYALPFGWSASTIVSSQIVQANVDWKWGLRVVPPISAVVIILLALVLLEPRRQGTTAESTKSTVFDDVKHIMTIKSFLLMLVAIASVNIVTSAQGWWNPTILQLAMKSTHDDPVIYHGMQYAVIQSIIGIQNTVGGILGGTIAVFIAEWWSSRGIVCLGPAARAASIVGGIGTLLASPSTLFVQHLYKIDIVWYFVTAFWGSIMCFGTYALTMNIVLRVVPTDRRATATAIYSIFGSLLGDAPSPYIIGAIADDFRDHSVPDQDGDHMNSLLRAFYISNSFMVLCSLALLLSSLFVVKDERVFNETEEENETLSQQESYAHIESVD